MPASLELSLSIRFFGTDFEMAVDLEIEGANKMVLK